MPNVKKDVLSAASIVNFSVFRNFFQKICFPKLVQSEPYRQILNLDISDIVNKTSTQETPFTDFTDFTTGLNPFFCGCLTTKVHHLQQMSLHLKSENVLKSFCSLFLGQS